MFRPVHPGPWAPEDIGAFLFAIGLIGVVISLAWLLAEASHMPYGA